MHAPAIEVVRVEARLHRAAGLVGRVMLLVLGHRGDSERVEGRGSHRVRRVRLRRRRLGIFNRCRRPGYRNDRTSHVRRFVGDPVMFDSF